MVGVAAPMPDSAWRRLWCLLGYLVISYFGLRSLNRLAIFHRCALFVLALRLPDLERVLDIVPHPPHGLGAALVYWLFNPLARIRRVLELNKSATAVFLSLWAYTPTPSRPSAIADTAESPFGLSADIADAASSPITWSLKRGLVTDSDVAATLWINKGILAAIVDK
jgi:hypothetical protein